MFTQIFLFEIRYRLRRPAFYIYFFFILILSAFGFAKGDVPVLEKEMVNSPASLAQFCATASIFLLLVSSAIMGTPLYRDLEHNTKEYYLSYPITKAGYFWGRFLGSFFFVLMVGLAVILGAWLGSLLGPALGWTSAHRYGPHRLIYYLYPWLTLIVPTLFFTSAVFFGLVAIFRNVKVIYSSGLFFFLGYILANFFLHNIHNDTVTFLSDPFLQNGLRIAFSGLSVEQLNHQLFPLRGLILENRILWASVGAGVLAVTWWRFSFERFFSGRPAKDKGHTQPAPHRTTGLQPVHIRMNGPYPRRTLFSLTRIELLNIIRDNYFWIILSGGYIFLCFVFWHGPGRYGVNDYPRTIWFVNSFDDIFMVFIFLIVIFYTGETVHREKLTRFAFINDALPPADWILNTAKLLSLCCLATFLALTPILLGLPIQLLKGYHHFNFSQYLSSTFISTLPQLIAIVFFGYAIHLVVNNKFAAHGIAITIWAIMFLCRTFNYFNYELLLYSYAPSIWTSDMDGIGHMAGPISWFNIYWTTGGLLLVAMGSLFFARGVDRSARERLRLARQRFHGPARTGAILLFVSFLAIGSYIYYNVSYLNDYTTPWEHNERNAIVEKHLKQYASLPLPRLVRLSMTVDLFPDQLRQEMEAAITIQNKDTRTIDTLLLDGDGLDFEIKHAGVVLPYTNPLYFPAGKFDLFRPRREPSDYRLYILPKALLPGDSMQLTLHTTHAFRGFQNGLFGGNALHNGTLTTGNLPGLGYDEGDEIWNNDIRTAHGLPVKKEVDVPYDDVRGRNTLVNGVNADLLDYDLTVSTTEGQWVQSSGRLEKEWRAGDRHYFHFVQDHPGLYPPVIIAAARYTRWRDTVKLDDGRTVSMEIDYHLTHTTNLAHFQAALRDGLRYYSRAFGPYPYDRICLVESQAYGPREASAPGTIFIGEPEAWTADLRPGGTFDYAYYTVAVQLAHQWWGYTVMPNKTLASPILNGGLPWYSALALLAQRQDSTAVNAALGFLGWDYSWGHRTDYDGARPLISANKGYEQISGAALHLFTLARAMGTDSLNAALHAFRNEWALRNGGPYAGAHDLYNALQAHVPDTLRTWLADAWLKPPGSLPSPPITRR